jgi:hypothetical protein
VQPLETRRNQLKHFLAMNRLSVSFTGAILLSRQTSITMPAFEEISYEHLSERYILQLGRTRVVWLSECRLFTAESSACAYIFLFGKTS